MKVSRIKMKRLLKKYPFLIYRNIYTGEKTYSGEEESENLKYNYYTVWNRTGWKKVWLNYLKHVFYLYDNVWTEDEKKAFSFLQIKEKYGSLRIYTSFTDSRYNLEVIAEMLSEWTCISCGKTPRNKEGKRIIWRTTGWICPYCEKCAKKEIAGNQELSEEDKETLDSIKEVNDGFKTHRYSKDEEIITHYKETKDGWLEVYGKTILKDTDE